MNQAACEKIVLADALGVKLLYCENCEIVELEIGAMSIRLSPDMIQRMANVMMKASLKLDRVIVQSKRKAIGQPMAAQRLH